MSGWHSSTITKILARNIVDWFFRIFFREKELAQPYDSSWKLNSFFVNTGNRNPRKPKGNITKNVSVMLRHMPYGVFLHPILFSDSCDFLDLFQWSFRRNVVLKYHQSLFPWSANCFKCSGDEYINHKKFRRKIFRRKTFWLKFSIFWSNISGKFSILKNEFYPWKQKGIK